jgi:hypothetical protein
VKVTAISYGDFGVGVLVGFGVAVFSGIDVGALVGFGVAVFSGIDVGALVGAGGGVSIGLKPPLVLLTIGRGGVLSAAVTLRVPRFSESI